MTRRAGTVIVGAGLSGWALAARLAALGAKDLLVLEQGEKPAGGVLRAPGLVWQQREDAASTRHMLEAVAELKRLRWKGRPGFLPVGSLRLASSHERLLELKRLLSLAKALGLETQLLAAHEAKRLLPLAALEGLHGALFTPSDGLTDAELLAAHWRTLAEAKGAAFRPRAKVVDFDVRDGRVVGLSTPQEDILCERVVLAAGVWSPALARLARARLPAIAMQHQTMLTGTVAEVKALGAKALPIVCDPDNASWLRQSGDGLLLGGWEPEPAPAYSDRIPKEPPQFSPARFEPVRQGLLRRFPGLASTEAARKESALVSWSADGRPVVGPAPELEGLWYACGFSSFGPAAASYSAQLLAEWIVGAPTRVDWSWDSRRFGPETSKAGFVSARAREAWARHDELAYPARQPLTERKARLSAAHGRQSLLGAVFGEAGGWERPAWFAWNEAQGDGVPVPKGWAAKNWSPAIGAEHKAAREAAAFFDLSSSGKFELSGRGTGRLMAKLAPELPPWLSALKLADDRFRLSADALFGRRAWFWLRSQLPYGSVELEDASEKLCRLALCGPMAHAVLQSVCGGDLSLEGFPAGGARTLKVSGMSALLARTSPAGGPGFELWAEMKEAPKLWDALYEAGRPRGLLAAGFRALDSLQVEAGVGVAGLTCLVLDDASSVALGGEAVEQNGRVVGRVERAAFAFASGKSVAWAALGERQRAPETRLEVELFGERAGCAVSPGPVSAAATLS